MQVIEIIANPFGTVARACPRKSRRRFAPPSQAHASAQPNEKNPKPRDAEVPRCQHQKAKTLTAFLKETKRVRCTACFPDARNVNRIGMCCDCKRKSHPREWLFVMEDQSHRRGACNGIADECHEPFLGTSRTFPKKGSCIQSTMAQNGIGFSLRLLQSIDNSECPISECVWQISISKREERQVPKECSAPLFEKHNKRQVRSQMQAKG